ncbi:MAG: O-methyltransferase [Acidobacteriota bacterium]|nr:O-methyltransferase [Acidobacteriota bacterium]
MPPRKPAARTIWADVDRYFGDLLAPGDEGLDAALEANRQARLPAIDVSRLQGKFLEMLVRITQARRILEIGTLGGYSTIWMARALPEGGRLITLEADPRHAEVARANLKNAGVLDRVDLRVGRALDSLPALEASAAGPFDLIFIDADKPSNPEYLQWALKLSHPGTLIAVDNVVRQGKIIDAESSDPDIAGTRRMTEFMAAEPRLSATVLQTVGAKGYDGFALSVVLR